MSLWSHQTTTPTQSGRREPRGAPMWSTSDPRSATSTRANPAESLVRAVDIPGLFSSATPAQTGRRKNHYGLIRNSSQRHQIVVTSELPT